MKIGMRLTVEDGLAYIRCMVCDVKVLYSTSTYGVFNTHTFFYGSGERRDGSRFPYKAPIVFVGRACTSCAGIADAFVPKDETKSRETFA